MRSIDEEGYFPVEPKPPTPRWVSPSSSAGTKAAVYTGAMHSCATARRLNGISLGTQIDHGHLQLAAVVAVHHTHAVGHAQAVLDGQAAAGIHQRHTMGAGQLDGKAGGTRARCIGASVSGVSSTAHRSAAAAPGVAYCGTTARASNFLYFTIGVMGASKREELGERKCFRRKAAAFPAVHLLSSLSYLIILVIRIV